MATYEVKINGHYPRGGTASSFVEVEVSDAAVQRCKYNSKELEAVLKAEVRSQYPELEVRFSKFTILNFRAK